ncbi:hypothetical protein LS72_007750 [Helicobacter apodemus]|uniref:Uncharacterized protein n=1 Tax=Helicobacter apodemus TaxID=135569 RepID=A0A4U8UCW7_9HELI|nr:hypothetical protein [Helicobacter apodemus]TLE14917.1 hypothetical protein LS72_007750 [Helicobacter apodemus]
MKKILLVLLVVVGILRAEISQNEILIIEKAKNEFLNANPNVDIKDLMEFFLEETTPKQKKELETLEPLDFFNAVYELFKEKTTIIDQKREIAYKINDEIIRANLLLKLLNTSTAIRQEIKTNFWDSFNRDLNSSFSWIPLTETNSYFNNLMKTNEFVFLDVFQTIGLLNNLNIDIIKRAFDIGNSAEDFKTFTNQVYFLIIRYLADKYEELRSISLTLTKTLTIDEVLREVELNVELLKLLKKNRESTEWQMLLNDILGVWDKNFDYDKYAKLSKKNNKKFSQEEISALVTAYKTISENGITIVDYYQLNGDKKLIRLAIEEFLKVNPNVDIGKLMDFYLELPKEEREELDISTPLLFLNILNSRFNNSLNLSKGD